jgi:hypothetical protein
MRYASARFLAAALAASAGSAVSADRIQVTELGPDHFELRISIEGTTDPADGQVALVPRASALCGTRHVHWGRYQFDTTAPSVVSPQAPGPAILRYAHQITCEDTPQSLEASPAVPPAPAEPPTTEDEALIRDRTEAFLAAKDTGDFAAAHAMFNAAMASYQTPESMQASRAPFNDAAGAGVDREVIRITWYDDPAGAPTPGRYVAADYRASYPSRAFYCGYVVWIRQYDGSYLIARQEEGQATPDIVEKAAPEEIPALRQQLACRD